MYSRVLYRYPGNRKIARRASHYRACTRKNRRDDVNFRSQQLRDQNRVSVWSLGAARAYDPRPRSHAYTYICIVRARVQHDHLLGWLSLSERVRLLSRIRARPSISMCAHALACVRTCACAWWFRAHGSFGGASAIQPVFARVCVRVCAIVY